MRLMLFGGALWALAAAALAGCDEQTPVSAPREPGAGLTVIAKTPEGCIVYLMKSSHTVAVCRAAYSIALN